MNRQWLLEQWADEVARTLQSMTDSRPEASCEPVPLQEEPEFQPGTFCLEIAFSLASDALAWVALPPETLQGLGQRTLQSAGIDDAGPEEIQGTCVEILQQAHAGLAQAISTRLKRAITSKGREVDSIAAGNSLFRLNITYPESPVVTALFAVSASLLAGVDPPVEAITAPTIPEERAPQVAGSKTFEVLLDVSLPVSVSFGRTEMAIKEVLKLTTGSIVELNRALSEPVEVVINDRVIARGEVVVVDGNYGVRIHHIVSRQERFRSSAQAAMISKTNPPHL